MPPLAPTTDIVRVLCSSHTSSLTGSAVSLFTLVSGLDRRRFEPLVVLAEDGPLRRWMDTAGVPSVVVPYRGWHKLITALRALALLRAFDADVAYVNCAVGFSRAVSCAAAWWGTPVVWHVREPPDGRRVRRNRSAMIRRSSRIVVVSDDLLSSLAGQGPPVDLVDNGVDLVRFHPGVGGSPFRSAHSVPADAFVFGLIGTLKPRKNTLLFLDAAEQAAASWPGARFMVIGSGQTAYVDAVRARVAGSALLRPRVVLTGSVEDMPPAIAACDCVVLPSAWEGCPRVLLESMCMARPVIASTVGAVPTVIDDGRTGFLVPPGAFDATLAAMGAAIADPARVHAMGTAAAETARSRFSQDGHVARMSAILAQVARAHRTPDAAAEVPAVGCGPET